jgi:hypothetical protein
MYPPSSYSPGLGTRESHHDARKKWCELMWMETLNVRTDIHATSGLETGHALGNPAETICLIPLSEATLRTDHTNITSHYATHLRKTVS